MPTKHPKYWLHRAEVLRTVAEKMDTESAKSQMLEIARGYENMAKIAEKLTQDAKGLQTPT